MVFYPLNETTNDEIRNRLMNTVQSIVQDVKNPDLLWIAGLRAGIYSFNKKTEQLEKLQFSPLSTLIKTMKTTG